MSCCNKWKDCKVDCYMHRATAPTCNKLLKFNNCPECGKSLIPNYAGKCTIPAKEIAKMHEYWYRQFNIKDTPKPIAELFPLDSSFLDAQTPEILFSLIHEQRIKLNEVIRRVNEQAKQK